MVFEKLTSLSPAEVLDRAEQFFGERVPTRAAFPEQRSEHHLSLRGQGGEEIAIAVRPAEGATRVRASTLLFDQQVDRFVSTLPASEHQP